MRTRASLILGLAVAVEIVSACRCRHGEQFVVRSDEVLPPPKDASAERRTSVVIAKGRGPIAVGPTSIAFTNPYVEDVYIDQLLELSKGGGVPIVRTTVHFPRGFALGDGALYFLDEGPFALYRCSSTGISVLADERYYAALWKDHDFVKVRDGYVYWLSGRTVTHEPGIMKIKETGGIPRLLLEGYGEVSGLDVDGERIYVTTDDGVITASIRGGGARVLAPPEHGMGDIHVNGSHVYWLSFDWKDVEQTDLVWQLNRVPLGGGAPEVILDRAKSPHLFALTQHSLYWLNWHEIHRADLEGRNDEIVDDADGWAVAADEVNVYFTNGNEIRRLAEQ